MKTRTTKTIKTPRTTKHTFSATAHGKDGRQLARVDGFADRLEAAAALFELRLKATRCTTFYGEGMGIQEHDRADIEEADDETAAEASAEAALINDEPAPRSRPMPPPPGPRKFNDDIEHDFADRIAAATRPNGTFDRTAALKLAKANGLDVGMLGRQDNGRCSMGLRNMLRARARKGEAITWI